MPSYKVYAVDISELICDDDNVYDIKKKASNKVVQKSPEELEASRKRLMKRLKIHLFLRDYMGQNWY